MVIGRLWKLPCLEAVSASERVSILLVLFLRDILRWKEVLTCYCFNHLGTLSYRELFALDQGKKRRNIPSQKSGKATRNRLFFFFWLFLIPFHRSVVIRYTHQGDPGTPPRVVEEPGCNGSQNRQLAVYFTSRVSSCPHGPGGSLPSDSHIAHDGRASYPRYRHA